MDNAITWKLMLKEKTFIASLYSASNLLAKKILLNANDWQLRVTIQILHLIQAQAFSSFSLPKGKTLCS